MEIFISWSGDRSLSVAKALRNWLPKIVNALKPWLSSSDIGKGARWSAEVAMRLSTAKAGIICLTADNLHSDWILFEAGALSKAVDAARVCTLLIGLEESDLEPPLSQFQATKANEQEILALVKTLNQSLGENALSEEHVADAFRMCWPTLKEELENHPAGAVARPVRSERELLEEILVLVRSQVNPSSAPSDDDRLHIVQGRANKLIWQTAAANQIRSFSDGKNIQIEVVGKNDRTYMISIPKETPLEDIERHVLSQIPGSDLLTRAETLPPADALPPGENKTAGP
jgi:hypothetical protein